MNNVIIGILVVIVLLILWLIGVYNSLIRLKNRVKEAWSDIDVQLKRRYDLIPNLVEVVNVIKYSGKVHVGALLTEVEYRLDVFIILYFLNAAAVGIYSIGAALAQISWYASNSVNNVLFPNLSSLDEKDKDVFTSKVTKYTLYSNILIVMSLVVFGYPLVSLLYGFSFIEAYYVFLILSPGLLFDSVSRSLASWLKSSNKPMLLSKVSAISLILNIILCLILIPDFGIYGAAISSSISYILRMILLMIIFTNTSKLPVSDTFVMSKYELIQVKNLLANRILKIKKR